MKKDPSKYIGKTNYNSQGYLMEIVEYYNSKDILVEFKEPYYYRTHSRIDRFMSGHILNPYGANVCGIGITGCKYPTSDQEGKHIREYQTWSNMIKRCYDEKYRYKNPTYYDVSCHPDWLYYENFYEWIHSQSNYDVIKEDLTYAIDKDILHKGNKEYAPDKCCLVPQRVNNLFIKSNKNRGDLPIGVHYQKKNNKYVAQCGGHENSRYLGIYSTPEEAFAVYKKEKEREIKQVAQEEFDKGTITKECYEALMNYEVEITD